MPIDNRDYFRGEHPPACTCADCVQRRLETGYFRYTKRSKPRGKKKLLFFVAVSILLTSIGVAFAFYSDASMQFLGKVSDTGKDIVENISERASGFTSDSASSPEDMTVAVVETDCTTTPATRARDGEYVHEPIDVISADTSFRGNFIEVSGRIIDRCREIWSLDNPSDYAVFAIYKHPEPTCSSFSNCPPEEPIGGILEPLSAGRFYTNIDPGDIIANSWTLGDDGFEVSFRPAPQWGETFRLGIWGWDVENRRPGHLGEVVVRAG